MLELDHVRFAYPGQSTPYDFSLDAAPGKITLLMGRSGSGKSTLLDLIAGFQMPQSGQMQVDDTDLLPLPPEQRPVSILFQNGNLFEHLDVTTNLRLGLPRGTSANAAAEKIKQALDEVGLSEFARRRAGKLSGGQQQRVALARTLLRDRPVLLLDEPFANLDSQTAGEMRRLVKQLTETHGWHTLVVSHLREDAKLADKAYSLLDGVLSVSAAA